MCFRIQKIDYIWFSVLRALMVPSFFERDNISNTLYREFETEKCGKNAKTMNKKLMNEKNNLIFAEISKI